MKSLVKILALFIIVNAATLQAPVKAQVSVGVSFQVFFDQLSPYGQWVNYPGYGYGWIPAVGAGFSPYATAGHWVFTTYGWTWVSDYTWGWAAFHYGRWNYDPWYGWIWIPDNVWGPAWVSWREAPGYYGWAPMGWGRNYYQDYNQWTFCGDRYFDRPDQDRYYIDQSNNTTIINNSTVINNTYVDRSSNTTYVTGPDANQVRRKTGRTIDPISVQASNTPGEKMSHGQLNIYKPRISENNARGQSPAPAHVVNLKDVKPRANNNAMYAQADVNPSRGNGTTLETRQQNNSNGVVKNVQQPKVQQTASGQEKLTGATSQNSSERQHNQAVKTQQQQVNTSQVNNVKQQSVKSHENTAQMNRQPMNASQGNSVKQQPAQVRSNTSQVNHQQQERVNAPVNNSRVQQNTQTKSNEGKVNRDVSVQQKTQDQQPKQSSQRKPQERGK